MTQNPARAPAPVRHFLTPDDRSITEQLAAAIRQPWALLGAGALGGMMMSSVVTMLGLR